jgi:hypothetical protein
MRDHALIKGHRMQYDFALKKPLPRRPQADLGIRPSAEQIVLVHSITSQFLRLLRGFLIVTEQSALLASDAPFHLFELSEELCRIAGLDNGCAVLLDLLEISPKLVWNDDDLAVLQRMPIDRLRAMCRELSKYTGDASAFVLLTADLCPGT